MTFVARLRTTLVLLVVVFLIVLVVFIAIPILVKFIQKVHVEITYVWVP